MRFNFNLVEFMLIGATIHISLQAIVIKREHGKREY